LRGTKHTYVYCAAIGLILALIVHFAINVRRISILERELAIALELTHEMSLVHTDLEAETQILRKDLEELQAEELYDPIYYRAIQLILDRAPEMLGNVFNEDVELNAPEDFIMLPSNRILIRGQWFCTHDERSHTVEAIFRFTLGNDHMSLSLLNYSQYGQVLKIPADPGRSSLLVRHHELETVPVRFYEMGGEERGVYLHYDVEYLNGETFSEELAYYTLKHLNRRIIDLWFRDRIMYVNLHHREPRRMRNGTFGEYQRYSALVTSMASVPGIDAFVILVNGHRESNYGSHGASFRDIYFLN